MKKVWYFNTATGEIVCGRAAQRIAVGWYREGVDVIVYLAEDNFTNYEERGRWEH